MEPILETEPRLQSIQEELAAREPIFHHPELGTTRADLEAMTVSDFWEVGASGRRYSREYVFSVLEERSESPGNDKWETSGFHCREIAPDNYLLTYTLDQQGRITRRATLWRRTPDGWKIVYHQGTVVHETRP